jgi:metal-sulfur cluster biosynthetic enzyme
MPTIDVIKAEIISLLQTVIDPEIPVDIWNLGLVYGVNLVPILGSSLYLAEVIMTLTSPSCPAIDVLPQQVQETVEMCEFVSNCDVHLVWEPRWSADLIPEEIKIQLGLI